ncbi:shikimate kinase [Epibacterium ulvae]|uniref:shikimate kinase n=1 Tax=Epibacterium ulvae TaxID=1156985 RepID=UPI002492EBA5|nr:shikimate kinase [Epibacterium ulvae]
MNVFLTGPSGTGKSSVGPRLGAALGKEFADTDVLFEQYYGCSGAEIIRESGISKFREMEEPVLLKTLSSKKNTVISSGAGSILIPSVRILALESCWMVWLRTSVEVIASRLCGTDRAIFDGKSATQVIIQQKSSRDKFYALAHEVVDTDNISEEDVALKVKNLFINRSDLHE